MPTAPFIFSAVMPITRQKKEDILTGLTASMKEAKSVFFAKNLGLSVKQAQEIRKTLRDNGGSFSVAKKTLIKKAAKDGANIEIDDSVLDGAIGTAFALEDELGFLKALTKLQKTTKKIEITGGIFEGKVISKAEAIALSKIPSREELLAKLLGAMLAPISGFVGASSQVIAGFVRVTDAYREQKAATENA